jgi:hypothetical protein
LAKAFESIDTDGSGGISTEEFRVAIRKQLPSLAVLSDAQLEVGAVQVLNLGDLYSLNSPWIQPLEPVKVISWHM